MKKDSPSIEFELRLLLQLVRWRENVELKMKILSRRWRDLNDPWCELMVNDIKKRRSILDFRRHEIEIYKKIVLKIKVFKVESA